METALGIRACNLVSDLLYRFFYLLVFSVTTGALDKYSEGVHVTTGVEWLAAGNLRCYTLTFTKVFFFEFPDGFCHSIILLGKGRTVTLSSFKSLWTICLLCISWSLFTNDNQRMNGLL